MGEERFEFHQLPRDVESEVGAQAKDTVELFEKWCEKWRSGAVKTAAYQPQGPEWGNEICNFSLQQTLSVLPEGDVYTGTSNFYSSINVFLNPLLAYLCRISSRAQWLTQY